jgi:hypothetical protein
MDDESIGVNMDSGLCDQISNDILEMMVRSCPFRMLPSVVVGSMYDYRRYARYATRGSVAGKPEALHDLNHDLNPENQQDRTP